MRTSVDEELGIDDVHTRAICEEIGDRLREMLARSVSELPPRLRGLVQEFERADQETGPSIAPSLAPSIEDMTAQDPAEPLLARWLRRAAGF
jgi:hypothetical protein